MKVVIDRAIPYIEGVLEPYAEVVYCLGGKISADMVRDADALIIRTRTKCNSALLEGSKVKHIATATIGFDHIDLDYCRQQGIRVTTAAGCNARAVLQWMAGVLVHLSQSQGWSPADKKIGVVGVGNVGRLIAEYCQAWGFEVLCCDPPRAQREGIEEFKSLEELASQVDILTLHTPLNSTTHHFVDSRILDMMPKGAILINASRGEVLDSVSLKSSHVNYVLDVWENEPHIDETLLERSLLATHHIAGYSKQGKANGTAIVVRDIAESFSLPIIDWYPEVERIESRPIEWEQLKEEIGRYVDIVAESENLKSRISEFEQLRNNYNYRDEFF